MVGHAAIIVPERKALLGRVLWDGDRHGLATPFDTAAEL